MRKNKIFAVLGTFALTLPFALTPLHAEIVGSMTAMQTNISGTGGKTLSVGSRISLGDQLTSNNTGLGMIVFNDESSAKIGPNSNLTIDEFVYQRGRNKGTIGVKMKRGLVRFYGGQISKAGKMQITTPHIVLGVRGGILDAEVGRNGTVAILRAGQMFCNVNGKRKVITKPGYACISNGSSLTLKFAGNSALDTLDSLDQLAGNGVPGSLGSGIDARTACAAGGYDNSKRCKSRYGHLPGIDGNTTPRRDPIFPLGSKPKPPEVKVVIKPATTSQRVVTSAPVNLKTPIIKRPTSIAVVTPSPAPKLVDTAKPDPTPPLRVTTGTTPPTTGYITTGPALTTGCGYSTACY